MAHFQQLEFIRIVRNSFPEAFAGSKVLEVGSWDVTGTIRGFFSECEYLGVDITSGPGIDMVCQGQDLDLPSNSFDVVVSCECFEHNKYWLETFTNMTRMLKPGGLFIMSCAAPGRIEHGTSRRSVGSSLTASFGKSDYYRNLCARDIQRRFPLANHFDEYGFAVPNYINDLYFIATKRGGGSGAVRGQAVKQALQQAAAVALPEQSTQRDRWQRLALTWTGRAMEHALGAKNYQDLAFAIHKNL